MNIECLINCYTIYTLDEFQLFNSAILWENFCFFLNHTFITLAVNLLPHKPISLFIREKLLQSYLVITVSTEVLTLMNWARFLIIAGLKLLKFSEILSCFFKVILNYRRNMMECNKYFQFIWLYSLKWLFLCKSS